MWGDQAGTVAGKLAAKFVQRQGIETMEKDACERFTSQHD